MVPLSFNATEHFLTRIDESYSDQNLVPVCPDFFVKVCNLLHFFESLYWQGVVWFSGRYH